MTNLHLQARNSPLVANSYQPPQAQGLCCHHSHHYNHLHHCIHRIFFKAAVFVFVTFVFVVLVSENLYPTHTDLTQPTSYEKDTKKDPIPGFPDSPGAGRGQQRQQQQQMKRWCWPGRRSGRASCPAGCTASPPSCAPSAWTWTLLSVTPAATPNAQSVADVHYSSCTTTNPTGEASLQTLLPTIYLCRRRIISAHAQPPTLQVKQVFKPSSLEAHQKGTPRWGAAINRHLIRSKLTAFFIFCVYVLSVFCSLIISFQFSSGEDGNYVRGKVHMHSIPSQKFPQSCLWNSPNVHLIDDGPLSSFQERFLSASSFRASLLQATDGVMFLALSPRVMSQAPQHFRSSEMQASYDGYLLKQSICLVISSLWHVQQFNIVYLLKILLCDSSAQCVHMHKLFS